MKEHKYKAWDTVKKVMYSAEELGADQEALSVDGRGLVNISGDSTKLSQFHTHLLPLEYTGLRDKDNREAYHRDILKDSFFEELWVIEWSDEYAGFELQRITENKVKIKGIPEKLSACRIIDFGKIIGSIYEYPELLGERKEMKQ